MNGNAHKCGRSFFLFSVKWVVPLQAVRIACCRKVRSRSAELEKKAVHDSDIKIQMIDSVVYPYPTLFRIDTNNQKETVATQVSSYVLCPQSICYISDGIAYRMTEDGSKKQLCDKSVDYFLYCDDTQAVFITQDMQTAAIVGESIQCYDNIFQAADDCCLYREDEEFHVVHYHS